MSLYVAIAQLLGFLTLLSIGGAVLLLAALATPAGRAKVGDALVWRQREAVGIAWFVSLTAMAGSLYFSDVVGFEPCLQCWYQRIAMYPLVAVLGVGLLRSDSGTWQFGLPLSVIGFAISVYHITIQFQPNLAPAGCAEGVPCSARYMAVFGFVSIPWMAGGAFLLITGLLLAVAQGQRRAAMYADASQEDGTDG